jgi:hypothetical protein
MRLLAWDIERVPHLNYNWGLWDQRVGINQIVLPGETVSFAARWYGEPKKNVVFRSTHHDTKQGMLDSIWELIDEADALLSWNGKGFDTKHINTEFILAGMTPPSPIVEVDLLQTARRKFKFASNKLQFVSEQLGVGSKVKHEGFDLWLKCIAGDDAAWSRMRRYNKQDVHLLIDLYDKLLPWINSHPNRILIDGKGGCPRCGEHGKLESRGTRATLTGTYQRYRCLKCGSWSSSGKRLQGTDIREVK